MTELRQEMIRAMELKNLSHHTQRAYLSSVKGIAKHYGQSPDKINPKMIEDYLLYLKHEKKKAPNSCGNVLSGLRFFHKHVMGEDLITDFSVRKIPRKLPEVLTMEDVWKLITAAGNLKHRMILMTAYSAGLRAGEVINLKPELTRRFCLWLSRWTEREYRLPTEREWRTACGETPSPIGDYAWVKENSHRRTHPVAARLPNKYGLHDMFGNAQEWVTTAKTLSGFITVGGSWLTAGEELTTRWWKPEDPAWFERDPQVPRNPDWYTDAQHVGFRIFRPGK